MFTAKWTLEATRQYNVLQAAASKALENRKKSGNTKSSRQEGLFKQVHQCVRKLMANPKHPGLAAHQFHSLPHPWNAQEKVWEVYAQNHTPGAYRVFFCYGPGRGEIMIIAITPHP